MITSIDPIFNTSRANCFDNALGSFYNQRNISLIPEGRYSLMIARLTASLTLNNPYSAGIDFRREILTSSIDPRTVRVKILILAVDP